MEQINCNPERKSTPCAICGKKPIYSAGESCYCADHRSEALAAMKAVSKQQDSQSSVESYRFDWHRVGRPLRADGQTRRVR